MTRVNPRDIALKDTSDQYVVESILKHKGELKRKGTVPFLVKWEGYDEPAWEPWKNVRDNEHLHAYLKNMNLDSSIPKKFT
jgi:hypothetical protein